MSSMKRQIGAERVLLMLPLNVVMVARVKGHLTEELISDALKKLKNRHKLLAVRAQFDSGGTGWYVDENVPNVPVEVVSRTSDDTWLEAAHIEIRKTIPIETGPLLRCVLVKSDEVSEIIFSGNHVICDGRSLGYLVRDLLQTIAFPNEPVVELPAPPMIDESTVPNPPKTNWFMGKIIGLMNKKWKSKNIRFNQLDQERLHQKYWGKNDRVVLSAWTLTKADTTSLLEKCRKEEVTVNAALWAAFLAAQHEVQNKQPYHDDCALAVSTRDKLIIPTGDALGFYASSLTFNYEYKKEASFWETARAVQERIKTNLNQTNLFRMIEATKFHPTLWDSLYFAKYDGLMEKLPWKFLKKMKWDRTSYGIAITNVGKLDIPVKFGSLELETIWGPMIYSDVDEKFIGVTTVGGKLGGLIAINESVSGEGVTEKLRAVAMKKIAHALEA